MTLRTKSIIFFAMLLLLPSLGLAQNGGDVLQSNIDADSFKIDSKTGAIHFSGNVEMRHGAFLIKADNLLAYSKNNVLQKAVAQGSPTTFEQLSETGQPAVSASGNEIEFTDDPSEQTVQIRGNALLRQAGITAVCNEINFYLEDGVVQNMDGSRGDSQCQVSSNSQTATSTE